MGEYEPASTTLDHDPTLEEINDWLDGATSEAISNLKRKGISIFYFEDEMEIREDPDGSRYQIEYLPEPRQYRVVRQIDPYL
jgi:hypothetical protein